ncbi:sulfurtransferase [Ekhidna sp.]|uniref:sulfurtransferase n=1 Tax=Ekhidna sp. TaxID=2608089 RepID=UPI003519A883
MNDIVSTHWLEQHLNEADLIVLDASQSTSVKKQENAYEGNYIPGSIAFSLKEFSEQDSEFPNTLSSPEWFSQKCRELGVNHSSKIVVYDNAGIYWSPRVWWMFKVMGHNNIAVLDGGLPAWIKDGKPITDTLITSQDQGDFKADLQPDLVKYFEDIQSNLERDTFHVVDARSAGRFDGSSPEPREGLDSGHIPNSANIPFEHVLQDGYFKSEDKLKKIFNGVDQNKELVFSCGSGLTACITMLAHHKVSNHISPIYDGSWTEWVLRGGSIAKEK